MSKFCGSCGTKLDDAAKVCSHCGKPLEVHTVASNPTVSHVGVQKKETTTNPIKLIAILAVIVVIAVILGNVVSGFTGYKGAVRKIMNAFDEYDLDTISSMSSDLYYSMGIDDYAEDYFGNIISTHLDNFENQVGPKCKISYEVIDSYRMKDHNRKKLIDSLSNYVNFDVDIISKVMVVEVDVTAKEKDKSVQTNLKLTLTKEKGKWRLLYMN